MFVLMITVGVAVFMYRPSSTAIDANLTDSDTLGFGEFLLVRLLSLMACSDTWKYGDECNDSFLCLPT